MMIIRGVNVFPSQIEELIAAEPLLSFRYVIEIDRPDRLDVATVTIESREALDDTSRSKLGRRLETAIKSTIGVVADVAIAAPVTLKPSEGKAVRVIDRRSK
jgi:phenylacetate-CoA ligase